MKVVFNGLRWSSGSKYGITFELIVLFLWMISSVFLMLRIKEKIFIGNLQSPEEGWM